MAIPATFQSIDFYPHYRSSLPVSSHASNVQITGFVIFPCLLWGSFVFLEIFLTFVGRGGSVQINALGNSVLSTSGPGDLLDRSTAIHCASQALPTTEEGSPVGFPLKHVGFQVGSGSWQSSWACIRARYHAWSGVSPGLCSL